MKAKWDYIEIRASEVPGVVRFGIPPACQGQAIEIAYGDFGTNPTCEPGAPYRRIIDRSIGPTPTYYRLARRA